jgi:hypothetical protein
LLSSLLNEPIVGQGVFWSSVGNTPYPIPLRVLSFETLYSPIDPKNNKNSIVTYASSLRKKIEDTLGIPSNVLREAEPKRLDVEAGPPSEDIDELDALRAVENRAIETIRRAGIVKKESGFSVPWGVVWGALKKALPETLDGRDEIANRLVPRTVTDIVGGRQNETWHTERKGAKNTTFIIVR